MTTLTLQTIRAYASDSLADLQTELDGYQSEYRAAKREGNHTKAQFARTDVALVRALIANRQEPAP